MRCWLPAVAVLAAALFAAASQADAPVATAEYTLHDAARDRDIPIKVYFPAAGGPYPLILFSHGYGGTREGYVYLAQSWAAAGYVVILPTHPGSDIQALHRHGVRELKNPADAADLFAQVSARPRDLSFILDSLAKLQQVLPALAGKIDPTHVGAAGHSMGAGTTMYLAGAVMTSANGSHQTFADPRIQAFVALSPQGPGEEGFTADSWSGIHAPFMAVVGSSDEGVKGEPAEWRLSVYRHLPPGDKYSVWVPGANHMSFADKLGHIASLFSTRGQSIDIDTLHGEVQTFSLLFWNGYLKGDAAARRELAHGVSYQSACAPDLCPVIDTK